MTLDQAHINHLKDSFQQMESKEDFLSLLNDAKLLVYGEMAKPFELRHLNYHINTKANARNRYRRFSIPKKSGEKRIIYAPNNGLKSIQKCLNLIFQVIYNPSHAAMGFVPGKSIVDNAKVHAGNHYVYNIDLKDFFPSIDQARWWGRLQHPPFNLKRDTKRGELANMIAVLCCNYMEVERMDEHGDWQKEKRWVLPQGAPTSPTITNIICQQLDFYLLAAAKRFGLKYTRYADDITFSSLHNVYQKDGDFLKELHRIIAEQHFHIKESKTRLQKQGYRQEVTGLLVNDKPNVQKRYIKQLRMWLYYWEQYGYDKANIYFRNKYIESKSAPLSRIPKIENVISGKLDYLKMVKGNGNSTYLGLKERFERLMAPITESKQVKKLEVTLNALGLDPAKRITDPDEIAELMKEFDINQSGNYQHLNSSKTITNLDEIEEEVKKKSLGIEEKRIEFSKAALDIIHKSDCSPERKKWASVFLKGPHTLSTVNLFLSNWNFPPLSYQETDAPVDQLRVSQLNQIKHTIINDQSIEDVNKNMIDFDMSEELSIAEQGMQWAEQLDPDDYLPEGGLEGLARALNNLENKDNNDGKIRPVVQESRFEYTKKLKLPNETIKKPEGAKSICRFITWLFKPFSRFFNKQNSDNIIKTEPPSNKIIIQVHTENKQPGVLKRKIEIPVGTEIPYTTEMLNQISADDEKTNLFLHKPKEMVDLLYNFSKSESFLKYTTHSWEAGYIEKKFKNYEDFISKLKQENKVINSIKKLKFSFGSKLGAFVYQENADGYAVKKNKKTDKLYVWSEARLKYGWRTKELQEYCQINPTKDPSTFRLPNPQIINGVSLATFGQIMSVFKNEIEIREDISVFYPKGNALKSIFQDKKREHLTGAFDVRFNNLEMQTFFTDVEAFKAALDKIFKQISGFESFKNVVVSAEQNEIEKTTTIIIEHIESKSTRSSIDMVNRIIDGAGDIYEIYNCLKNLCDWSIEGYFADGKYRINYLVSDQNIDTRIPLENVTGFTHYLKFYKP